MDSGAFIRGTEVDRFESGLSNYLGGARVVSCGNGTDALQIAFMALNLPKGSEVITAAFSYAAVTEVLLLLGLKPVFAEVNPTTFLLDPTDVESKITSATSAIVPVHLFGQTCDMEAFLALGQRYNVEVIEDAAQAMGSKCLKEDGTAAYAGTMGRFGTTSFFPTKNLACFGDGGAVFARNETDAELARQIANHGQSRKYQHRIIGINSRLDELQAAILNVHLDKLEEFNRKRIRIAEYYNMELADTRGISCPEIAGHSTHVYHQYVLKTESLLKRNELKEYLLNQGVATAVYYPMPLYHQEAYHQNLRMEETENLSQTVLALPIHPWLTEEQILHITKHIKAYLNK